MTEQSATWSAFELGLLIAVILGVAVAAYCVWRQNSDPSRKKVILRTNIIILLLMAYGTVIILFLSLVFVTKTLAAEAAWNMLEAPLMTLIGGTLAISKDLIHPGEDEKT